MAAIPSSVKTSSPFVREAGPPWATGARVSPLAARSDDDQTVRFSFTLPIGGLMKDMGNGAEGRAGTKSPRVAFLLPWTPAASASRHSRRFAFAT